MFIYVRLCNNERLVKGDIPFFSFYCRSRGGKIKPITARLLLPFNNQSGDNFMLTVWSRSLGGCGGELWKKKIFTAVSASVFTCGPNDNTSPNFSWAIILNSCSSRHKKRERANKYQHRHTHTHTRTTCTDIWDWYCCDMYCIVFGCMQLCSRLVKFHKWLNVWGFNSGLHV